MKINTSKLNSRKGLLGLLLLVLFSFTSLQAQRIVGYTTSWAGNPEQIDYSRVTHLNYSFAIPTSNGGIQPIENTGKLNTLVRLAHARGVKVLIAVGGWELGDGGGNDARFVALASTANGRRNFVNNVIRIINQHDLDGVDIDWEYPEPVNGRPDGNFTALMSELSDAMRSRGKLLTAAVNASAWAADGIAREVFDKVDFLNIMAYDGDAGAGHSPYSYAEGAMNYYLGRGLPASKAVLGVPFYARPSWESYATLVSQGANANNDTHNGNFYNGINTIKAKAKLAKRRGSGIMIWTVDQDVKGNLSLLKAIKDEFGATTTPPPPPPPPTNPGSSRRIEAEDFVDMNGIQLENCSEGGQNVGYTDPGDWMAYGDVRFPRSGSYTIEFRVASAIGGSRFSVDLNQGANVLGAITIPNTGGWQNWRTVSMQVNVNAGTYPLGIYTQSGGYNLNWLSIRGAAGKSANLDAAEANDVAFSVYPNPATGAIRVQGFSSVENNTYAIYNILGAQLLQGKATSNEINISSLPKGMYLLRESANNLTTKFIKR